MRRTMTAFVGWLAGFGSEPQTARGLRAGKDVRAVVSEQGLAVFDMSRGTVFKANAVGATIWQLAIEDRQDPAMVAQELAARYGQPVTRTRADVDQFVAQLRQERLVKGA